MAPGVDIGNFMVTGFGERESFPRSDAETLRGTENCGNEANAWLWDSGTGTGLGACRKASKARSWLAAAASRARWSWVWARYQARSKAASWRWMRARSLVAGVSPRRARASEDPWDSE